MLKIIKNNWFRLMEEKAYLIAAVILTICSVGAAIVLTNKVSIKENIAVINHSQTVQMNQNPYLNITYMKKKPPMSQLVQNRYSAVITIKKDGSYSIYSVKSDDLKKKLKLILTNPAAASKLKDTARRIGTNIMGYMMMFLLIQGVLYARLFAEDKEKHRIERVAISPIAFTSYLFGNGVFMWLLITIPSLTVVTAAKILGVAVGFSILQYILLIGLLAFLAVSFALFLNSFFCVSDTANMLGSSIVLLTSILAGSFYSFTKENTLFNHLLHVLPQKDFINFTNALEKGNITTNNMIQLGYVILLSLVMLMIAIVKTRKDYVYKK